MLSDILERPRLNPWWRFVDNFVGPLIILGLWFTGLAIAARIGAVFVPDPAWSTALKSLSTDCAWGLVYTTITTHLCAILCTHVIPKYSR